MSRRRGKEREPEGPTRPGEHAFTVLPPQRGQRLDEFLSLRVRGFGKHVVRRWIGRGLVRVNGEAVSPTLFLKAWDEIKLTIPQGEAPEQVPRYLPIATLYEDEQVLVVNKPPGVSVLPGRSAEDRVSFFEGLLYYLGKEALPEGEEGEPVEEEAPLVVPRPRLAHRLDRDTSGVMVVAKTYDALVALTKQFEERTVRKEYLAVVRGVMENDTGLIEYKLAPHRKDPNRWQVSKRGREAATEFETVERFDGYSLVTARPRTGRTHQIRVHLKAIGHPLAVDPVYGEKAKLFLSELKSEYKRKRGVSERPIIDRLTLHARRITFNHPATGQQVTFESPIPDDIEFLLKALRKYRPRQTGPAETAEDVPVDPQAPRHEESEGAQRGD